MEFPRKVLWACCELPLKPWDKYSASTERNQCIFLPLCFFFSYFLNSDKLLPSPASRGRELHGSNCVLCEVFSFLLMLSKISVHFIEFPLILALEEKWIIVLCALFRCSIDSRALCCVSLTYLYSKWKCFNLLSPSSYRSAVPYPANVTILASCTNRDCSMSKTWQIFFFFFFNADCNVRKEVNSSTVNICLQRFF